MRRSKEKVAEELLPSGCMVKGQIHFQARVFATLDLLERVIDNSNSGWCCVEIISLTPPLMMGQE